MSLAASFLFRFFVEVSYLLEADAPEFKASEALPPQYESAIRKFERPAPKGMQYYTKAEDGRVVGQPERHMAADLQVGLTLSRLAFSDKSVSQFLARNVVATDVWRVQVTGDATYTDDVKLSPDFLHAVLVVSTRPYARILSVDPTEALKVLSPAMFVIKQFCCCAAAQCVLQKDWAQIHDIQR